MSLLVIESELYRSCEILFGGDLHLSRDFLQYLQPSGIKSAYRQKARETHPDLVGSRDERTQRQCADLFRSVQEAYENLQRYLEARDKGFCFPGNGRNVRPRGTAPPSRHPARPARRNGGRPADRAAGSTRPRPAPTDKRWNIDTEGFYTGPMPQRPLLFGHFLYYSGVVNWRSIVQALVWQRSQRPRLGDLGCRLGWLNQRDIRRVLELKTPLQPFGRSAVRLGVLQSWQLRSLLLQQKRQQKKIGQYFVESRLMTSQTLQRHVARYLSHNSRQRVAGGTC